MLNIYAQYIANNCYNFQYFQKYVYKVTIDTTQLYLVFLLYPSFCLTRCTVLSLYYWYVLSSLSAYRYAGVGQAYFFAQTYFNFDISLFLSTGFQQYRHQVARGVRRAQSHLPPAPLGLRKPAALLPNCRRTTTSLLQENQDR